MVNFCGQNQAFGHPGIEPRWTHGSKRGVGTAYSADSRIWFTLWNGVITEVYYPTIDRPQIRDLQYLVSDGKNFFHEEKRHLKTKIQEIDKNALGYYITNTDPEGNYKIHKEVIGDPHLPCVLQHTWLTGNPEYLAQLKLYALCAPHLNNGGKHNNAYVIIAAGREILVAQKDNTWLAISATVPFKRLSCGYVGNSDGWTDLADNYQMDWEFDRAESGNVALMGELDLSEKSEFTLTVAFGNTLHRATTNLFQSLGIPFKQHKERFIDQWNRTCDEILPLEKVSQDNGKLYRNSFSVLLAHEDKLYPGAMIASLSIPWGQIKGDDSEYGGYHYVWPRDLVNSAIGLLAAGETETPLRVLIYLANSQYPDGGFAQNFYVDGEVKRRGLQLDEVAKPIMLAWHLKQAQALGQFDPYFTVISAAKYLILQSPVTQQERWEQSSGFSPATLAVTIAALICAATWAKEAGDEDTARFIEDYADFLESHIEAWTVTTEGTLHPEIQRYYIRINPADVNDPQPNENPNQGMLFIPHRHPDSQQEFPAKEIVDPSFLELVRYGIRSPEDPLIVDSLKVVDKILKTETPFGSVWKRYNHDGHGQREDGSAWDGWGTGRSWTLLTGERGVYELAAGRDPQPFIRAMEKMASDTALLPEQVWDAADLPDAHMYLGCPTGSAMPLMWSHAEYIKLLRSVRDDLLFDLIPEVVERYQKRNTRPQIEVWQFNRQVAQIKPNCLLRIQWECPFKLRWSVDEWQEITETDSLSTNLGIEYVDISLADKQQSIYFTFYWKDNQEWEHKDYKVVVKE